MLKYSIKIDENEFYLACNEELVKIVSDSISYIIRSTRKDYIEIIKNCLRNDPDQTYSALSGGLLRADLGLADGMSEAEAVISAVANSIEMRKAKSTRNTLGGINLVVLRKGIESLLDLPMASYVSNGQEVEWLKWLLTSGDEIVVANYSVLYGSNFPTSRTGQAIMGKGKGFKIRGEHSGDINQNWITKALLLCAEKKIIEKMEKSLSEIGS